MASRRHAPDERRRRRQSAAARRRTPRWRSEPRGRAARRRDRRQRPVQHRARFPMQDNDLERRTSLEFLDTVYQKSLLLAATDQFRWGVDDPLFFTQRVEHLHQLTPALNSLGRKRFELDLILCRFRSGTITQNPQFFLFVPPTADTWKATIGSVTPNPTGARFRFTMVAPSMAVSAPTSLIIRSVSVRNALRNS